MEVHKKSNRPSRTALQPRSAARDSWFLTIWRLRQDGCDVRASWEIWNTIQEGKKLEGRAFVLCSTGSIFKEERLASVFEPAHLDYRREATLDTLDTFE